MERFLRLAREVHRRSLWQVFVIHLVGSWVGFQASQEVARGLELPSWFPGFTFVLLLLGLPVTVTTAYVQGGLAGAADPRDADPTGLERVFNWRNAIIGGILAVLLCAIVAIGWVLLAEHLVDQFRRPTSAHPTQLVAAPPVTQFR